MRTPNHPQKGSSTKVEPLRELKDIQAIKRLLRDKPRDYAIYCVGINTCLRACDILRIRVGQVKYLQPEESFTVKEKKTGKEKIITVNRTVYDAVRNLLATMPDADDNEPLFQSRKGKGQLTVPHLWKMVKGWCQEIKLKGNYGTHSLRKTFGYQHRVLFNTSVPKLMKVFNHTSQEMTLSYLCIQDSEIKDIYLCEI